MENSGLLLLGAHPRRSVAMANWLKAAMATSVHAVRHGGDRIKGMLPLQRLAVRQQHAAPRIASLESSMRSAPARCPRMPTSPWPAGPAITSRLDHCSPGTGESWLPSPPELMPSRHSLGATKGLRLRRLPARQISRDAPCQD